MALLKNCFRFACSCVALLSAPRAALAAEGDEKPVVIYDYNDRTFSADLPYSRAFLLRVAARNGEQVTGVTLWESSSNVCGKPTGENFAIARKVERVEQETTYTFEIRRLKYDTGYCLKVEAGAPLTDVDIKAASVALDAALEFRIANPGATRTQLVQKIRQKLGALADRRGTRKRDLLAGCRKKSTGCPTVSVAQVFAEWFDGSGSEGTNPFLVANQTLLSLETLRKNISGDREDLGKTKRASEGLMAAEGPKPDAQQTALFEALVATEAEVNTRLSWPAAPASDAEKAQFADVLARLERAGEAVCKLADKSKKEQAAQAAAAKLEQLGAQIAAEPDAAKQATLAQKRPALLAPVSAWDWCKQAITSQNLAKRLTRDFKQYQELPKQLDDARDAMHRKLGEVIDSFPIVTVDESATEFANYTARAALYISADVGTLLPIFNEDGVDLALYVGVNFYFQAVDKDVPLSEDGGFGKRFSLVAGVTLDQITDPPRSIEGVFGDQYAVSGMGYRVTDYIRLGLGAVWFRQADPNPTVSDKTLRATPYLSLSLDSDVVGLVKDAVADGKSKAR